MPEFLDVRPSTTLFSKNAMPFVIHEAQETGNPRYYGYISGIGSWIIMQQNTSTGAHRYAAGKTDFATSWTGRTSLTYGYFPDII